MIKAHGRHKAPYFRNCLSAADLDELNIEIIRNTLYKSYLEDFAAFCDALGEPTSDVMASILSFEADRRTINITVNSLGTQLTKEQRASLFPTLGRLYPAGNSALARADELDQVKAVVEQIPEYRDFFTSTKSGGAATHDEDSPHAAAESLEDHFFKVGTLRFRKGVS
jgi:V-type H+-transporting ATPase subunit d